MAQATRPVCQYCNGVKRGAPTQHDIDGKIVWLHRECVLGYAQQVEAQANPADQ